MQTFSFVSDLFPILDEETRELLRTEQVHEIVIPDIYSLCALFGLISISTLLINEAFRH